MKADVAEVEVKVVIVVKLLCLQQLVHAILPRTKIMKIICCKFRGIGKKIIPENFSVMILIFKS